MSRLAENKTKQKQPDPFVRAFGNRANAFIYGNFEKLIPLWGHELTKMGYSFILFVFFVFVSALDTFNRSKARAIQLQIEAKKNFPYTIHLNIVNVQFTQHSNFSRKRLCRHRYTPNKQETFASKTYWMNKHLKEFNKICNICTITNARIHTARAILVWANSSGWLA